MLRPWICPCERTFQVVFYDGNAVIVFQNIDDSSKELSLLFAQCELLFKFFDPLLRRQRCRWLVHGAGPLNSNGGALDPVLSTMLA